MNKKEKRAKIGIPRGLFYYRYFPFWKTFLEELGNEVVVSDPTDKEMLSQGIARLTDEVCLPVKAFCGQVISLKEKVDFILIPSIFSLEKKVHHCPKFIGLPDLIKAVLPEVKNILDPDINFDKGEKEFYLELYKLGHLFTLDNSKIKMAIKKAMSSQEEFDHQIRPTQKEIQARATIALVGHPYLLQDEYLNHRLIWHLENRAVRVFSSEMITRKEMRKFIYKIQASAYWTCEDEIIGAGAYFIERKDVDGIIIINAFGCGPDSTMVTFLENYARKFQKPILEIVLDEHTADTGLITRVEAFVDTIFENKKRNFLFQPQLETITPTEGKIKNLGIPFIGGKLKIFRKLIKENFDISLISFPVTSQTYELGVKYSPEFVCFPFKVILGNYIECLEKGVDTILTLSSFGPCRVGYYRRLLEEILTNLGYKFEMFKIKSEDKGPLGALRTIKRFTNNAPWLRIAFVFLLGIAKLRVLEQLEKEVQKIRAREIEKGRADQIFEEAIGAIDQAEGFRELTRVKKEYLNKLREIPKENIKPLKVGLIGEIFVLIEPFVNMEIEKELGKMGVEIEKTKSVYLSEYTSFLRFDVLNKEKRDLEKFTKKYLKRDVGGHGLESLGKKIEWSKEFDGLIHLMPFGCLPEVIAQNIMTKTEEKIPVLTIACDEKLGKAGLITRLEAFVDLLRSQPKTT